MLITRRIYQTKTDMVYSWIFILPVILILLLAAFIPLGYGLVLSFHRFKLNIAGSRPVFVGLYNYIGMFKDEIFLKALSNNIVFALLSVSAELVIGVVVAMMLSDDNRNSRVMITLLMVPMIIAPVAAGTLWRMMLDRTYGVINYIITLVGLQPVSWLGDYRIAIYTVIMVDCWQFIPFVAILVMSSIKSIPKSFLDAARVDGASPWKVFILVVLPITAPVIIIVAMIRFIDAFKIFDVIFVMTQGGPGNATEMLPTYIYRQGIKFLDVGYSSATAVLFILVMSLVAWGFMRLRNLQLRRLG